MAKAAISRPPLLTVLPRRPLPSFPRPLYRHSRVSGNPAVACQDCGGIRQYRSGFPLTREGRQRAAQPPHPLILNWLKDGPPPFRPIPLFLPPLPILQPVQDERKPLQPVQDERKGG